MWFTLIKYYFVFIQTDVSIFSSTNDFYVSDGNWFSYYSTAQKWFTFTIPKSNLGYKDTRTYLEY